MKKIITLLSILFCVFNLSAQTTFITPNEGDAGQTLTVFISGNSPSVFFDMYSNTASLFLGNDPWGMGYPDYQIDIPNNVSNWWGELDYEHFLVWDKYQANTLKKYLKVKKPKVITIGPMLSSCSEKNDTTNLTKKFIVIFDIVPERFSYNFFISYSIIKPKHIINFQNDILKIASELNVVVLHKIKRRRSDTIVSKSYIKNILNLKKFNNYKQINENQSIETLVKKSKGVISFPYTSTSLIAKYMKIPAIYYDSSKYLIDIEERIQSHGVKIINNIEELRVWMKNAIK